jgi:hypothetical protein
VAGAGDGAVAEVTNVAHETERERERGWDKDINMEMY